jgi:hypothetical protein
MIAQAKGKSAASDPATTQAPKTIIPTEIKNESTVSMMGVRKLESDKPLSKDLTGGLVPGHDLRRRLAAQEF